MPDIVAFGPPISPDLIDEFQRKHGVSLPCDYREFLLKWNGGRPTPAYFDVPGWPGLGSSVGDFFGFLDLPSISLDYWVKALSDRLPTGFIAIAADPGANLICLGLDAAYRGRIYYWDSSGRWEIDEGSPTMFRIAMNINDLLAKLTTLDEALYRQQFTNGLNEDHDGSRPDAL